MADVIDLFGDREAGDNVVCEEPVRFRALDWAEGAIIQCLTAESERYEHIRARELKKPEEHRHLWQVPEGFKLSGVLLDTCAGLFRHRSSLENMKRLYNLAGLMECLIHGSAPVLRTAMIRDMFNKAHAMKEELDITWRTGGQSYLLPRHPHLDPGPELTDRIGQADSLKELYEVIRLETSRQLDILMENYVFYLPRAYLAGA